MEDLQREAYELFERCRWLEEEIYEPMGYPVRELCNLIRKQNVLIERMTRRMTWKEAVDILNKHEYQGHSDWENPFLTRGDNVEFELFAIAHWLEITKEIKVD